MTIKLNGEEVFLKWKHHNNTGLVDIVGSRIYKVQSYTECWIEGEDRTVIGDIATAAMHHTDRNYVKETGRKVSLTRLMTENPAFASKADRKIIWNQYFNRCPNPGTKVVNAVEQSEKSTNTV